MLAPPPLRLDPAQLRQGLFLDSPRLRHGCRLGWILVRPFDPFLPSGKIGLALTVLSCSLLPYEDCDTFISTDAGVTWRMTFKGASKYEFGDQGSILVTVGDEEPTDKVQYSFDAGKTWSVASLPHLASQTLDSNGLSRLMSSCQQEGVQVWDQASRPPPHDHPGLDLAKIHPPRLAFQEGCR